MYFSGLNFSGPENTKEYKCDLDVIDNFSKFGWTIPLNNKSAPTKRNFFENKFIASRRKPKLTETKDEKQLVTKIYTAFLNRNKI